MCAMKVRELANFLLRAQKRRRSRVADRPRRLMEEGCGDILANAPSPWALHDRVVTFRPSADAHLLDAAQALAVDRAGGDQRVLALLQRSLELELERREPLDRLQRARGERGAAPVRGLQGHAQRADGAARRHLEAQR